MRRVSREGSKCVLEFRTPTATPNAIRRALMSDVETYAPSEIVVHANTSSQTDEFIAHRIGLIPFAHTGEALSALSLNVTGRTASSADFAGDCFRAPHVTPIVRLIENQTLHVDVRFAKGTAATHAKHAHVGPVSYQKRGEQTTVSFETLAENCPLGYTLSALESLLRRIDDSIFAVETQYDAGRKIS
tara:strand:- start:2218 stop:2781 length:564 start_codon:yes stop_codon:yes gene_type:complete